MKSTDKLTKELINLIQELENLLNHLAEEEILADCLDSVDESSLINISELLKHRKLYFLED